MTKRRLERITDLGNLPRGKVTVSDVIQTNDINEVLSEIHSKRASIEGLLVIWRNSNGTISYRYVKVDEINIIAMCDIVKQHCIQEGWLRDNL